MQSKKCGNEVLNSVKVNFFFASTVNGPDERFNPKRTSGKTCSGKCLNDLNRLDD